MTSASAIRIQGLSYSYEQKKKIRVIDDLSLDIRKGDFFALLGPNGAGKTTVISLISALLDIQEGSIEIFGARVGTREVKRIVGLVPQELVNHGFFSVEQVLKFYSGYFGILQNQKRIDFLLDRLALTEQRTKKVSALSGGMKRRFLIAKALLHSPKILLLDEPSAGVDVELRSLLWEFSKELNREGVTIVLTTHYLEEAERLCQRVAIMNQGRLLALDETGAMVRSMAERLISIQLREGTKFVAPAKTQGKIRLIEATDRLVKVACDSQ
jgi:ABC-2 type transport system ATP-binding protein